MLDLPSLGEAIARRRSELKLTQAALASRAMVSRGTIDSLENGRTGELGFTKIARILAALNLGLRISEASQGRPTLEDLLLENDDQSLDQRR